MQLTEEQMKHYAKQIYQKAYKEGYLAGFKAAVEELKK